MEISKEMCQEYHSKSNSLRLPYTFEISVLTKGCWPETDHAKAKIPEEMVAGVKSFE